MVESSTASNRRQPVRQTRTNPTRTSTSTLQPRSALGAHQNEEEETPPGFCPAITHFTDCITALPKEMIRHYTMLNEVDAKIYGPEELLGQLVTSATRAPVPPKKPASIHSRMAVTRTNTDGTEMIAGSTSDGIAPSQFHAPSLSSSVDDNDPTLPRRRIFANLRTLLGEMLPALDEKNHVILTATDCLDKQLARCDSSFPYINDEISEEARCGSKTHWAYRERTKATTVVERTTRHLAATAAIQAADGPAARSEVRREALAARKQKNHYVDSDFDETATHPTTKKANASSKGRKVADPYVDGAGLGISTNGASAAPPSKRRKTEKPAGGVSMQRAMSSVYGSNTGNTKGGSPRDTPMVDSSKKRGRVAGVANGTARKRGNTNASAANSPAMASSPIAGSFPTKDVGRRSPAPAAGQRAQPSRARQNSSVSALHDGRTRPTSSTSARATNGNGLHASTADVDKISGLTGRSVGEVKSSMKETVNSKGEHLVEDGGIADGPSDVRGAFVIGGRNPERSLKREETEVDTGKGRTDRPSSISIATRGNGKSSKTGTPISGSFSTETSRPTRAAQPPKFKRSHKKGAGIAAQMAAAAAAAAARDDENSSIADDDEEDDEEPRYCYCNGVSYGEMVGCDEETCAKEWFHLACVGLTKAPNKNAKWYCDECKEKLKRSKFANGAGR